MDKKGYFQCQCCGSIHRDKLSFNIEDVYTQARCPRCRGETKHLWVGDQPEDWYLYYDPVCDPRYYQYDKTIQND